MTAVADEQTDFKDVSLWILTGEDYISLKIIDRVVDTFLLP